MSIKLSIHPEITIIIDAVAISQFLASIGIAGHIASDAITKAANRQWALHSRKAVPAQLANY